MLLVLGGCTSGPTQVDDEPRPPVAPLMASAVPSTSSDAPGSSAESLTDGAGDGSAVGGEWVSDTGDAAPWAKLSWSAPTSLATVQVHGPLEEAFDPKQSTAAALHGVLRFSDGSTVDVAGIHGGAGLPTTVAFTPRQVTWVQLELQKTVGDAVLGLREMRAFGDDEVAPAPAGGGAGLVGGTTSDECDDVGQPSAGGEGGLRLVCPAVGASVRDRAVVVVQAPSGVRLTAWAADPVGGGAPPRLRPVAVGRADVRGVARLEVDMTVLPAGPVTLAVDRDDTSDGGPPGGPRDDALRVQLFNSSGVEQAQVSGAPDGMRLRYEDQFDAPLSASARGWGTRYGTLKPEPWGGSQFGEALFANPDWGAGNLSTVDGYLRMRVQPAGKFADRATWDQQHLGALLSSQRFGGSGFSAQHGYFEARLLGAPGPGAWSAFWAMNAESGTSRADGAGELDVVELYGHDVTNTCHSTHSWGTEPKQGELDCFNEVSPADWATSWHTYGALVGDGEATFFIDGQEVGRFDELSHTDDPFFFMLDVTLGGGWPIALDGTGGVTDLYVDWVRVYT